MLLANYLRGMISFGGLLIQASQNTSRHAGLNNSPTTSRLHLTPYSHILTRLRRLSSLGAGAGADEPDLYTARRRPVRRRMNTIETFCRQVRARSSEHQRAVHLLHGEGLAAQVVAILRQELDSMVRVIYLLSIQDQARRNDLVQASVDGLQWTIEGKNSRITDREMVDVAKHLQGWTGSVYKFGCAFIHLSSFHDYRERDPLNAISEAEKADILQHMRHYHGGPSQAEPVFNDLIPYLPRVFDKIASNLEYYISQLEADTITVTNQI